MINCVLLFFIIIIHPLLKLKPKQKPPPLIPAQGLFAIIMAPVLLAVDPFLFLHSSFCAFTKTQIKNSAKLNCLLLVG